ncbi:hypothetical protein MLD38_018558 [Melastoma candidum]|uniref:Uncharacterized protein n=1 Tax=Melastoma candidum TaxID=119954 RepID=A0ACB9QUD3_9MYRT|nr:hypothetical protein MLD38_018558 [Melastoma candidum]
MSCRCFSCPAIAEYCRNNRLTWRLIYLLFLGQLTSFILALTSFSSSWLADLGVDAPLTQMLFTYVITAVVFGSILVSRQRKLLVPWYWYLLLGFIDVQGNYLVNKAYQYSSITSVTLLDCFTIPWVIVLTWFFLKTKYSLWQLIGAATCILGLGLVLLSDAGVGGGGGSRPLLGDMLVVLGAVFFAMSNVGEEFFVKKKDLVEVVAMLGTFGTLVSLVQISIFERSSLEDITWSTDIILAFVGYAFSCFAFYVSAPFVLKKGGAALLNLSLLTSDMWAVLVRIFFYRQKVDWLYYLAFGLVIIGLVIYSKCTKEDAFETTTENRHQSGYQALENQSADSANE